MGYSFDGRRQARWILLPALVLVALVAAAVGASLYLGAGRLPYYGWWPWAPFGWFFFIPLFFIAFFALRFFWWGPWGGRGWYNHGDSAMQVLRERFARGEITKEQFEQMRNELAQTGGQGS
jgi:putative membrane protein